MSWNEALTNANASISPGVSGLPTSLEVPLLVNK